MEIYNAVGYIEHRSMERAENLHLHWLFHMRFHYLATYEPLILCRYSFDKMLARRKLTLGEGED